eukprot:5990120-Pleurochrysis_carterae.AAC.1
MAVTAWIAAVLQLLLCTAIGYSLATLQYSQLHSDWDRPPINWLSSRGYEKQNRPYCMKTHMLKLHPIKCTHSIAICYNAIRAVRSVGHWNDPGSGVRTETIAEAIMVVTR